MTNDSKKKIIIIIAAILFIIFDVIVIHYYRSNKLEKESFKYYSNLNLTENAYSISPEDYVSDSYLISLVKLNDFNGTITYSNAEDILRYYMTSITKNTAKGIKNNDSDAGFCITKSDLEKSFMELFNIDISGMYDSISYPNYITIDGNKVCFNYSYSDLDDYVNYIGIEDINVNDGIITAKLYLYSVEAESKEIEELIKENLIHSIKNKTLDLFNYYFYESDKYEGKIEEKEIVFKEIPDGNYFKYQLISINTK